MFVLNCGMAQACIICGADISHKRRDAKRCDRCLQDRINDHKRRQRKEARRTRVKPVRYCLDCPADITHRFATALRCEPCAKAHTKAYLSVYEKEWRRKRQEAKGPRLCADCGVNIDGMSNRAERCRPCAKERMKRLNKAWVENNRERMRELSRKRYRDQGGEGYAKAKNRTALLIRDGRICDICGEFLDDPYDGKKTHVDHIKLVSHGGTDDLSNLRLTHATCNLKRRKPRLK